jgi:RNA polymerase sigma-70 factor (ECF subfamily)
MSATSPAPVPSDEQLVASFRGGDERAATELVRRHGSALARFLYAAGAPPGEIEDLVQEAFIRAFRALDRWRGDATFRSWLFRIGGNLRKDLYRRERGRTMISILDQEIADRADPAAEAEAREAASRFQRGLEVLPPMQRAVFLLRAQQGVDYDEIAVALGTTPGAARVHYHHAVRRLKERMS